MQTRLAWKELVADDTTETHEFNWARHPSILVTWALRARIANAVS